MNNTECVNAIINLLKIAEPIFSMRTVQELKIVALNLQVEEDLRVAKLQAKQKACSHANHSSIGVHPHRGENLMRCPDCGLEWWD